MDVSNPGADDPTAQASAGCARGNFNWRDLKWWALGLPISLAVLVGRYDWSADRLTYSRRAYLASACVLMQVLPVLFYTMVALTGRRRAAVWLTVLLGIFCVLPYRWVGLAGSSVWTDHVEDDQWWKHAGEAVPTLQWLPGSLGEPAIPHEGAVFGLLILAGALPLWKAARGRISREWLAAHPAWAVGAIAFALIVAQSWLHLSMRAPYSYLVHFSDREPIRQVQVTIGSDGQPAYEVVEIPQPHGWWHTYLFPDHQGAVHEDYAQYRACEELFQGTVSDLDSTVIRRFLTFYFSSQFTCFFNPYYVFLFLNTACWLAAAMAGYFFARNFADAKTAAVLAILIATGSGFIFFVNQPMCYLSGYAAVMVLIYLFERLIVTECAPGNVPLFAWLCGLGMFVNDLWPMALFFLVYGMVRGVPLKRLAATAIVACACSGLTLLFLGQIAHVPNLIGNTTLLAAPAAGAAVHDLDSLYMSCLLLMDQMAMDLFHAFLILPILPALLGWAVLRRRIRIVTAAVLLLPALTAVAYLHFSGAMFKAWPLAALPRLAYIAYPGIYLLAAIGLVRGTRVMLPGRPRLAGAIPWLFLAAVFVVNNIDAFGVPAIYYHFYFGFEKGLMPFGQP